MTTYKRRPTPDQIPAQQQEYPASEAVMIPRPQNDLSAYQAANKLKGKVALITGGDSGIGRAVAIAYAMEGADIAIVYNQSDEDAEATKSSVEEQERKCVLLKGDVQDYNSCENFVKETVHQLGKLNILVNNAAYQMSQQQIEELSIEQFRKTIETNLFGYFYMLKVALPQLKEGDAIINTGSIDGMIGNGMLIDYAASKGAVHAFTKSLALNLGRRNIRVNCVVPGSVWTPTIPASLPIEAVDNFDKSGIIPRAAQPEEIAPTYVLLASADGSYITGALFEVTGGLLSNH